MNYRDIHASELEALRAEPELLIIDIRDPASYASGHLEQAEPVSDSLLKQLIKSRQRQRPVLVYCYHGNSSRDICEFISGFGFERVHNLAGGWDAWEKHLQAAAPIAIGQSGHLSTWLSGQGLNGLDDRTDNGMSPLMLAALHGERGLLEELLSLGADPNHVNEDDHHALWFACVHGDPATVAYLIDRGADIDNVNVNGVTCAVYAASTGKLEVLKCLVEAGADLSKETSGGYTALDSASTLPVLKYLRSLQQQAA